MIGSTAGTGPNLPPKPGATCPVTGAAEGALPNPVTTAGAVVAMGVVPQLGAGANDVPGVVAKLLALFPPSGVFPNPAVGTLGAVVPLVDPVAGAVVLPLIAPIVGTVACIGAGGV